MDPSRLVTEFISLIIKAMLPLYSGVFHLFVVFLKYTFNFRTVLD